MRRLALIAALASLSFTAHAQSFSPQLFHPAPGPDDYVSVESAKPLHHLQVGVGLTLDYARDPFSILTYSSRTTDPFGTKVQIQQHALSGELWVGLGLIERLQVALSLPMTLYESGQSFDGTYPPPDGVHVRSPSGYALGDPRLWLKVLLYGKRLGPQLAVSHWLSAPIGNDDKLGGEPHWKGWAGEPRLIGEWIGRRWSVAVDVGFHWRAQTSVYYSAGGGQELTYGGGAGYDVVPGRLRLVVELYGHHTFDRLIDYTAKSPLELDGSLRIIAGGGVTVLAGVGGGVLDGAGAPKPRVFVGLGWLRPVRDRDHDGIADGFDRCPDVAEDRDGFEDEDGCPEADNDHDSIHDPDDKCPNEPEDFDGWKDEDGCPDPDNDNDGIPDAKDSCPNDAEDHLPPSPNDGCPSGKSDRDGDGIPDSVDKCPAEAEDKDGWEDDDGCPDLDNDDDGIPDNFDECPNVKEDVDNVEDEDGCPDFGGEIRIVDGDLVLRQPIAFDGTRLTSLGTLTTDRLAAVLVARGTLKVRIEGYWDKRGDAGVTGSQALADTVRRRLIEKGVSPDRLIAVGYGVVRAPQRRVEIHVVQQPKPNVEEQ